MVMGMAIVRGAAAMDCDAPGCGIVDSRRPVAREKRGHDTGATAVALSRRQLRILHVINSTRPEGGGPIESIKQAAAAMGARGHMSEVACLDAECDGWLKDMPVTTHALGPARTSFRYASRLVPWLRANRHSYDCAIVHGIWLYPTYGAWRALKGTGLPYFVYTHGSLDPAHRHVMPEKHAKKMLVWLAHERRVLRDARAVFFTCELERDLANASFWPPLGKVSSVILPYCVASPPNHADSQVAAFRRRYPELAGKRLILFLGRIHRKKGIDLLLRAFAAVGGTDPNAHLVLAGSGDPKYEAELRALASAEGLDARTTWTGMLSGDLKWGAFRAADAFALISHQENYGIAVVEALGCGVPVLMTDKINIWPTIEQRRAGLVGQNTVASARDMLSLWLAKPAEVRDVMRRNARACFEADFCVDQAADMMERTLIENCEIENCRIGKCGDGGLSDGAGGP